MFLSMVFDAKKNFSKIFQKCLILFLILGKFSSKGKTNG